MTLPQTYRTEDVAEALGVTVQTVRDIIKRPGAPRPARLSDSPTAPMRFTEQDVKDLIEYLRPEAVPEKRRRRRKTAT